VSPPLWVAFVSLVLADVPQDRRPRCVNQSLLQMIILPYHGTSTPARKTFYLISVNHIELEKNRVNFNFEQLFSYLFNHKSSILYYYNLVVPYGIRDKNRITPLVVNWVLSGLYK
jgi:hypothetical protein